MQTPIKRASAQRVGQDEPWRSRDAAEQWLRLIRDRRWSRKQKQYLLQEFVDPANIYAAPDHRLRECVGRYQSHRAQVEDSRIEQDLAWLSNHDCHLLTPLDQAYPWALQQIDDAPIALFARGDINLLADPKVAIVGSRRPTPVGAKIAETLASELAKVGLVVTSGMALGIDALAHQAALNAGGGTIAVMGCGLDQVYPQRHRQLFSRIASHGLLLSEFPLGMPPKKEHFPQRNRIVSGLCLGVVIVEAAERSGTLITARLAAEQNREVMVVPGSSLSPQYQGSHRLLQQGAALVAGVEDILITIGPGLYSALEPSVLRADATPESTPLNRLGEDHVSLLSYIGYESTDMDSIISGCGLTAAEVSAMLLTLELEGLVAIAADGGYVNLS